MANTSRSWIAWARLLCIGLLMFSFVPLPPSKTSLLVAGVSICIFTQRDTWWEWPLALSLSMSWGAYYQGIIASRDDALMFLATALCITLLASRISRLCMKRF